MVAILSRPPCVNTLVRLWTYTWWHYQMEIFSALLAICAGNSPVPGEFTAQRPVTPSFDVFFDLRLNKRLNKQSRGWWFETLSRPLWRHPNERHPIFYPHGDHFVYTSSQWETTLQCNVSLAGRIHKMIHALISKLINNDILRALSINMNIVLYKMATAARSR